MKLNVKFSRFLLICVLVLGLLVTVAFVAAAQGKIRLLENLVYGTADFMKIEGIYGKMTDATGVEVELMPMPEGESFFEKQVQMNAVGNPPELLRSFWSTAMHFMSRGLAEDLGGYISRDRLDISDVDPAALEIWQYRGAQMGLPTGLAVGVMFYNKTMFQDAGLALPPNSYDDESWDWNEFLRVSLKLTKRDAGGKFTRVGATGWPFSYYMYPAMLASGKFLVSRDGTKWTANDPDVYAGYNFFYDLIHKYKVIPTGADQKAMAVGDLFMAGRSAMAPNGTWFMRAARDITDFEWDITPIPRPLKPAKAWVPIWADGYFMASKISDKSKEDAWNALKWFVSPEGQMDFAWGFGGGIPASKKVREGVWISSVKEDYPNLSLRVLTDASKYGFPMRGWPYWAEFQNGFVSQAFSEWMLPPGDREKTPEQIIAELTPQIRPLIQEYADSVR